MSLFERYMGNAPIPVLDDALANYIPEYAKVPNRGAFAWVRLSDGDYQACVRDARAVLKERGTEIDNSNYVSCAEELETEVQWQLLWRAMRDPERKGKTPNQPYPHHLAKSAAELAEHLPTHARIALIQRYTDWVRDLVPSREPTLSDDELRGLQLQVRDDASYLRQMTPCELRGAVLSMLDRIPGEHGLGE